MTEGGAKATDKTKQQNGEKLGIKEPQFSEEEKCDYPEKTAKDQELEQEKPPLVRPGIKKCFRVVMGVILFPFVLLLSLLGLILWIVLLPLKCCCPCLGVLAECVMNLFETVVKLPINFFKWIMKC